MDILYKYGGDEFVWDSDNFEERGFVIGFSLRRRLLIVVHTERREQTRIISARKATRYERKMYEKA